MANIALHRKALELRSLEMSYSQIKRELGVSKSTLSDWLKGFPLSKERISELRDRNDARIEKYRNTRLKNRLERLKQLYDEECRNLLPLNDKEFYIAGLLLYWGEGNKGEKSAVSLTNTDPRVVQFFLKWLTRAAGIAKASVKVTVHLYKDMDVEESLNYWSDILSIPRNQFIKPYIKESKRTDIDQKGYGHGTCGLYINNVSLKMKILAGIRAIADKVI